MVVLDHSRLFRFVFLKTHKHETKTVISVWNKIMKYVEVLLSRITQSNPNDTKIVEPVRINIG